MEIMKMTRGGIQLCLSGLLAAGGLLGGCTAGPVEDTIPEEARLVEVRFAKPDLGIPTLLTRAEGAEAAEPTPLPTGSTVRIAAYYRCGTGEGGSPVSFSTTAPDLEATYRVGDGGVLTLCPVDDAGKPVAGKAEGMVIRGGVYDFYAVSPARKLAKNADGGTWQITDIPHKEDVMTSFARSVTISGASRQVTLSTFSRKCALVVFNVAPSKENALPFSQLYGTKLVVSKISSSGASLVAGDNMGITPTGGNTGAEAVVTFESAEFVAVEAGSDPGMVGLNKTKGVLLPKSNGAFDVEIEVQRDDKTATLKATIDKNISFEEGKRYVFTLEVKNNESSLLLTVLDWNAIPFTDTNVGGPDTPYPDPDINVGIGTTVTVAQWSEIPWSGNGNIGGGSETN